MSAPAPVGVVIPARDAARFLAEALASVRDQQPPPAEIVVVDDGSRDDTAAIAATTPGVRLVRQAARCAGAARNSGALAVSSEWLAFLDADDLWLPGKLAAQLAAAAAEPALDGVFTHIRNEFVDATSAERYGAVAGEVPGVHASTLLVRRTAFLAIGGFDEQAQRSEFIDWYARAVDHGVRFRVLPELGALRRIHGANLSLRRGDAVNEYVALARQRIRARRAGGGDRGGAPC